MSLNEHIKNLIYMKMISKIWILVLLNFSIWNSSLYADTKDSTYSNIELVKLLIKGFPDETQLSIALVKDTMVNYLGFIKEKESLSYVNNNNSVYEIGSITKIFTTYLLADFASNHILKLDDSIDNILPYKLHSYSKSEEKITFKTLANHTSGLTRDPVNYDFSKYPNNHFAGYSYELLDDYLKNSMEIYSEPGERYDYSNLGMGILGYLLEYISSKKYEQLLQEKICVKFNMTSTTTDRKKIADLIVTGQDVNGKKTPNWDLNSMVAAGGILSNVVDLSKFAIANFSSDTILKLQRTITYQTKDEQYALGWNAFKFGDNHAISGFCHGGGTGGYSSFFVLDVNNKLAVIILTNVSAFFPDNGKISILGFELLRNLYNIK
jgi:CubicO group peptidase (beta-lactamase class C family)